MLVDFYINTSKDDKTNYQDAKKRKWRNIHERVYIGGTAVCDYGDVHGMCMGITAATALHFNLGLGISLGVLIGEVVGMMMKKKK